MFCPLPQRTIEYLSIFPGQTERAWSGKLDNSAVWLKPPLLYSAWHHSICKHWLHWQNCSRIFNLGVFNILKILGFTSTGQGTRGRKIMYWQCFLLLVFALLFLFSSLLLLFMELLFYLSFPIYILLVTCTRERHQEQLLNKLWLKVLTGETTTVKKTC